MRHILYDGRSAARSRLRLSEKRRALPATTRPVNDATLPAPRAGNGVMPGKDHSRR